MTDKEELRRLRDALTAYIEDESTEIELCSYETRVNVDDSDPTNPIPTEEVFDIYRVRLSREVENE